MSQRVNQCDRLALAKRVAALQNAENPDSPFFVAREKAWIQNKLKADTMLTDFTKLQVKQQRLEDRQLQINYQNLQAHEEFRQQVSERQAEIARSKMRSASNSKESYQNVCDANRDAGGRAFEARRKLFEENQKIHVLSQEKARREREIRDQNYRQFKNQQFNQKQEIYYKEISRQAGILNSIKQTWDRREGAIREQRDLIEGCARLDSSIVGVRNSLKRSLSVSGSRGPPDFVV